MGRRQVGDKAACVPDYGTVHDAGVSCGVSCGAVARGVMRCDAGSVGRTVAEEW